MVGECVGVVMSIVGCRQTSCVDSVRGVRDGGVVRGAADGRLSW